MTSTPIYQETFQTGGDRSRAQFETSHKDRDDDGIPIDPHYKTSVIPEHHIDGYKIPGSAKFGKD